MGDDCRGAWNIYLSNFGTILKEVFLNKNRKKSQDTIEVHKNEPMIKELFIPRFKF